jgi:hypothetical protein
MLLLVFHLYIQDIPSLILDLEVGYQEHKVFHGFPHLLQGKIWNIALN